MEYTFNNLDVSLTRTSGGQYQDMSKLGFSEEQIERMKIIGECIRNIHEKQELDKIEISQSENYVEICILCSDLVFDKREYAKSTSDWNDWKRLNEAATSIDIYVSASHFDEYGAPLLIVNITLFKNE